MKSKHHNVRTFVQIVAAVTATFALMSAGNHATAESAASASFCGTKPIKIALATGFNGNSWRQITRAELEDEASKCKNITEILYTDGQLNPQKAISDIQGLVAQGTDAIVVFPDAGPALLPAIRAAHKSGVSIVPYISSPGGEPGKDYSASVVPDNAAIGALFANWMAERLHGKGVVVFFGGTPGNPTDQAIYEAAKKALVSKPDIKLVGGVQVTNYTAADAQKAMTGLLAQYPDIGGIISSYGGSSVGALRAIVSAGKPLVPLATTDINELGCAYYDYKPSNPAFELMTVGSYTWQSRAALRKAVAGAEGLKNDEPSVQSPTVLADSTRQDLRPRCDKGLPLDVPQSANLSVEQLKALFAKK
ncbi:MAG: substrate-binding domain-containing protein [Alphaproteobacteria bacterium]|nr:substrate-binding domain-containing protein [Alphaproteobacteria bacterium]